MIIDKASNLVRSGIMGETEFTMKATAKAFDIMINTIYSDKVGAVVREICSNAKDSHNSAGKNNVPFKISVPTTLDPHFTVEDEGTGLPPEKIKKLFSNVFDSTKEDSNDDIGAFGLGSKSPFSLTDSFTVMGNWYGKKYMFLVFKNERRIPSILETGCMDTDEPNGITVKIPVNSDMYDKFIQTIKRQLFMFEPKPIVTNVTDFKWWPDESIGTYLNTRILKNKLFESTHNVSIGGVVYPLDRNKFNNDNSIKLGYIGQQTITDFPIGSLDIQASRESLSYDAPTIKALEEYYAKFFAEYEKVVLDEINTSANAFEAWKVLKKHQQGDAGYWNNIPTSNLKFGDVYIGNKYNDPTLDFPSIQYDKQIINRDLYNAMKLALPDGAEPIPTDKIPTKMVKEKGQKFQITEYRLSYDSLNKNHSGVLYHWTFGQLKWIEQKNNIIVFCDNDVNVSRKIKQLILNIEDNNTSTRVRSSILLVQRMEYYKGDFNEVIDLVKNYVPDAVFHYTSALTIPKTVVDPNRRQIIQGVFSINKGRKELKLLSEVDMDSPYVLMSRELFLDYKGADPKVFKSIFNGVDANLYGIQKGGEPYLKKIISERKGLELKVYMEQLFKGFVIDPLVFDHIVGKRLNIMTSYNETENINAVDYKANGGITYLADVNRRIKTTRHRNIQTKPILSDAENILIRLYEKSYQQFFKGIKELDEVNDMIEKETNRLPLYYKQYPLLRRTFLDSSYNSDPAEVIEYIKMVDQINATKEANNNMMI